MILIAILLAVGLPALTLLIDKKLKQQRERWEEKRQRLLAIGEDDDESSPMQSLKRDELPPANGGDLQKPYESGNPYQPPQ
jgi:NADH:ubiquinone oxidoreductase subunit 3 (subunit A)